MDFVAWCDLVLQKVIEVTRNTPTLRSIGIQQNDLAPILFDPEIVAQPGFSQSFQHRAMMAALGQSVLMSYVEGSLFWKVTRTGREAANDHLPHWYAICQEKLDEEHQQLLRVMNQLSSRRADRYAWLDEVTREDLQRELDWTKDLDLLWPIAQDLHQPTGCATSCTCF